MENQFSERSLQSFKTLVGAQFEYLAGPTLDPDLVSDLVLIQTNSGTIAIQGDILQLDVEGFDDTYSQLVATSDAQQALTKAKRIGNLYFFKAGETISKVLILRDEIRCFENHEFSWKYVSDSGLILQLDSGFIAITKLGYHDELLSVSYLEKLDSDEIPTPTAAFEDNLDTNIVVERKFITLEEALGEVSE